MAALVIKDLPNDLHKRLKAEAERHRRSMTQQAVVILEQALRNFPPIRLPEPIKPIRPISGADVVRAIRKARDGRR